MSGLRAAAHMLIKPFDTRLCTRATRLDIYQVISFGLYESMSSNSRAVSSGIWLGGGGGAVN
jgi:hypothetical protein